MTATEIHPTAVVAPGAELGEGVRVGPHTVIEDHVRIGDRCQIGPQSIIHSYVEMGVDNKVHGRVVLGDLPQDLSFDGRETWVRIGDRNTFRESVTIHRSTDELATRLGSDCYLMVHAHVAHNCQIGDHVILTNNVLLAGHVTVDDHAILGGAVGVHQFVRIGTRAMIAGGAILLQDIIPYTMAATNPAKHYRLNSIGLRRSGMDAEHHQALERAFRSMRRGGDWEGPDCEPMRVVQQWLNAESKRGVSGFASSRRR